MCGIAGYYAFGKNRPNKDAITKMFIEMQSRGRDASGFAYVNQDELIVRKQPLKAEDFVKTAEWGGLTLPKVLIMHCRQGTQGKANDNKNNHPIFTKSGLALVHNGNIRNDHTLFRELPLARDGDVDSEIVVKMIELGANWDDGMKNINKVKGSMACAVVSRANPNDLLLFRNSNPIVLAYDNESDILYFGSTKEIVSIGCTISTIKRGFIFRTQPTNITIWDMPKDTGYLISRDGLDSKWDISDTDKGFSAFQPNYYDSGSYGQGRSFDNADKNSCGICGKKNLTTFTWYQGEKACYTCVSYSNLREDY